MSDENPNIVIREIDFLIPSYTYNIRYSYTSKRGLSFVREYILRLAQLGAISAEKISEFFNFNERETKEAISDLLERDELRYSDFGTLALTEKSKGYFEYFGSPLLVGEIRTTGCKATYELLADTCLGIDGNAKKGEWKFGCQLEIPANKLANREKIVSKLFQREFQEYVENKLLKSVSGVEKANIYKVEGINQIGQTPLRLPVQIAIDVEGKLLDFGDFDELNEARSAQDLIHSVFSGNRKSNNRIEILDAMEQLGDYESHKLFKTDAIDIRMLMAKSASSAATSGEHVPFVGNLYSETNWSKFMALFQKEKKILESTHQDGIVDLLWLVPSDAYWHQSLRLNSCLNELISSQKTTGKKAKPLYKPRVLLPLADPNDKKEKSNWLREFSEGQKAYLEGYVEGFKNGDVEVLALGERLVAVTYYLSVSDVYPVPIPLGFITRSGKLVRQILSEMNGYLSSYTSDNEKKLVGKLK